MKGNSKSFRWLIVSIFFFLISLGSYYYLYHISFDKEQQYFQEKFSELEQQQLQFKNKINQFLVGGDIAALWKNKEVKSSNYFVFVFQKDSLKFWNNNRIAVHKTIHNGYHYYIGHFPNGYYLIDQYQHRQFTVFIGTLIKSTYVYQNDALSNVLNPIFRNTNDIQFYWDQKENSVPVFDNEGNPLIYIHFSSQKQIGEGSQLLIFISYVMGLGSLLITILLIIYPLLKKRVFGIIFIPVVLLSIRYLSIQKNWIHLFTNFQLFNSGLYASSTFLPNLGSLIITLLVICICIWWVIHYLNKKNTSVYSHRWILVVFYLGSYFFAGFIHFIFQSLILNSSIPLIIDNIFSLNIYSIISLIIIAVLFLGYFFLIKVISLRLFENYSKNIFLVIGVGSGLIFILLQFFVYDIGVYTLIWLLILNGLILYMGGNPYAFHKTKYNLLILVICSLFGAIILYKNNQINEHQKRELYAAQLISDQDPQMEVEYGKTMKKIYQSAEFHQLLEEKSFFTAPNFALQLENCCFNSFWERYEMRFYFFHADGSPLRGYLQNQSQSEKEISHIIRDHTTPSSITKGLYFVNDYYKHLSYVGKKIITTSTGEKLSFYILFQSKKIPEQIGFPRLLMNKSSYVLEYLENYSFARYFNGELVMQIGSYNFPTIIELIHPNKKEKTTKFVNRNGMSHLVYRQGADRLVLISLPEKSFLEQLSTFSYLLFFFGIVTLIVILIFKTNKILSFKTVSLSFRVQSIMIGMITTAFVIFVIIAVKSLRSRYNIYTQNNLRDKISAIKKEVDQAIGNRTYTFSNTDQKFLDFLVKQLAFTFKADINFYALNGQLVTTSQPKVFQKGIGAPLMNNSAYYAMNYRLRSEFIHHEHFGKLSFYSGYIPYRNNERKLLGYINIQHFSKQNAFKSQLNNFIVAIINIAVLFLVVTVVIAFFVSRWITGPLRLIQESFQKMELGKENQPIAYSGDNEIGALVKDYNNKVLELELKAMQLAKSERESAWREMAKQVAHEIKNPLTPMKLRVQHFQRSFDPLDINAKEKVNSITQSLIEQIDILTKITNEFSNFAKMPTPNEERLDLIQLIQNVINLYSSQEVLFQFQFEENMNFTIYADRNLMIRVFNNLIKNAIQAAKEQEILLINIAISQNEKKYCISLKDSGMGISEEIQSKIFVPNFTTKSNGSGLGLAMVKQIIQNHNGKIWFETEEGEGTTFFIELRKL